MQKANVASVTNGADVAVGMAIKGSRGLLA